MEMGLENIIFNVMVGVIAFLLGVLCIGWSWIKGYLSTMLIKASVKNKYKKITQAPDCENDSALNKRVTTR